MARASDRLKYERSRRNWSQEEVADKIGTTASNVSRWERGSTFPNPYFRRQLCELFQKSTEELFPELIEFPLSSKTYPVDPAPTTVFFYKMELHDTRECYGRAHEKTVLFNRTLKGAPTSIVGPRGIGKTWLMSYLKLVVPTEAGAKVRIGYLDATIPTTLSEFVTKALSALSYPASSNVNTHAPLDVLEKAVQELRRGDHIPILCIDEFERFCTLREFHMDVLGKLRGIMQTGLGLVTGSKRPLSSVIAESVGDPGTTSPFVNHFRQLTLKPFTLQEAQAFAQTKGNEAQFTAQDRECVLKYARQKEKDEWLPSRLQLVGTLLQEDKILAELGNPQYYRPDDSDYWQEFEARVEEKFQEG